jgi:hypothetical protein
VQSVIDWLWQFNTVQWSGSRAYRVPTVTHRYSRLSRQVTCTEPVHTPTVLHMATPQLAMASPLFLWQAVRRRVWHRPRRHGRGGPSHGHRPAGLARRATRHESRKERGYRWLVAASVATGLFFFFAGSQFGYNRVTWINICFVFKRFHIFI